VQLCLEEVLCKTHIIQTDKQPDTRPMLYAYRYKSGHVGQRINLTTVFLVFFGFFRLRHTAVD